MNMDNKKYDDLDKLFQSRLKGDNVVKEDWNQPPRSVFDGAMANLGNIRRKRRKQFLLWFLFAIVAAGIGSISFYTYNRINRLENTIATLQEEKNDKSNVTTEQNSFTDISGTLKNESFNQNPNEQIKQPKSATNNQITNIPATGDNNFSKQNKQALIADTTMDKDVSSSSKAGLSDQQIIANTVPAGPDPIVPIGLLYTPLYNIIYVSSVPSIDPVQENLIPVLSDGPSPNFSIYALGGLNATTIKMTNTEGADFSLTGYEKYYADVFAGFGSTYHMNDNWGIDLQASYNRMHVQSLFEDEIVYDASLETIDNQGNVHYDAGYDIFSVIGRQSSNLSLVNENQINDKDQIMNQTTIDNSFRTIGLSLGTFYSPVNKEKFTLSIGAGAQYNYLLTIKEEMETTIQHNNELVFRASTLADPMEQANRNYWSWYANLRLGYKLTETYGIQLDLGTAHSVSSIRKTTGPADSETFINNLRTAVLVYYRF